MAETLSEYFTRIGRKGGRGCSPKKLAHLKKLAKARRAAKKLAA